MIRWSSLVFGKKGQESLATGQDHPNDAFNLWDILHY